MKKLDNLTQKKLSRIWTISHRSCEESGQSHTEEAVKRTISHSRCCEESGQSHTEEAVKNLDNLTQKKL